MMKMNISELHAMIKQIIVSEMKNSDIVKPVIDNTEGEKFYKETEKKVKDHEDAKGLEREDFNKTTLDVTFDGEVSDDYKDRVKAQVYGYTSKMEMDNKSEKSGDYENNKQIYDDNKKTHQLRSKREKEIKQSGLTASKLPTDTFDETDLFGVKESYERLNFKNSVFLNETHMKSKIPTSHKIDGNKFIMKDANDNEYVVEWKKTSDLISEAIVLNFHNKTKSNKDINRINELFNYSYKNNKNKHQQRIAEDKKFIELLNKK